MEGYGKWKGVPRENIPWFPTIDASQCVGCRKCLEFCSHGVYDWDEPNNRAVVARPFQCVVGCMNCSHQCEEGAITFPPLTILKDIGKE